MSCVSSAPSGGSSVSSPRLIDPKRASHNRASASVSGACSEQYRKRVLAWQERAEAAVQRNVNYVPGLITHWWHGKKKDRGYADRWKVLTRWHYDPATDVRRDWMGGGLLRWSHHHSPRLRHLRDDVRRYLRSRNEDSVDVA